MDSDDGLEKELEYNVGRIMSFFRDVHGGAVPSPRLLVYSAAQQPSTFIGSNVLLNCVDLCHEDEQERQARMVAVVAHELAHAFWMYRVHWVDPRLAAVMNELIAESLEHIALANLGGSDAVERIDRSTLWSRIRAVLHPLERNPERWSGYIGALVLRAYFSIWPERTLSALRAMWVEGQEKQLSPANIAEIFGTSCNEYFGAVMADVSENGSLLLGKVRAHYDRKSNEWYLMIHPRPSDRVRLLTRLRAVGIAVGLTSDGSIPIRCESSSDIGRTYDKISPWLVLSRREARVLLLPLFGRLAPLLRFADNASTRLEKTSSQGRVVGFLSGLLWLLLNREAPDGYRLLASAIADLMPGLGRVAAQAAGRRAFHSGESRLRAVLVGA